MMRKLQLLAICAMASASVPALAQSNNLPNLSSDVGATITTNADSITGNENLVLSGGGAGVPVKPFFIGNNDNAAGTTITIGTGAGATTTINGSTSVGDALAVGGSASVGNSLAVGGSASVGNSLAVTNSASVGGTLTVNGASSLNGIDNNGQVISNVAPGVASTDAATVGQLESAFSSQTQTNNNQATFNQAIQSQTAENRRISSTGIAIVAAAAALPGLEAGKQFGIGAAMGTFDGRSAIAVGMVARITQALQIKLHVGTGHNGNPLCAALRGAHLARAGAMLVLALGAAQAGATTYTVPLQFNLTLAAPVCSLTVGSSTHSATSTPSTVTVDLTPPTATPLSAISNPNTIAAGLTGISTSNITANAFGVALKSTWAVQRLLTSPPAAEVLCTSGTPVIARLSKGSTLTSTVGIDNTVQAGEAGSGQSITGTTLPVGMLMGMSSFAGNNGTSGTAGTTNLAVEPTIAGVATGSVQTIALTAAVYANSTAAVPSGAAGLWTYKFNVNLDF